MGKKWTKLIFHTWDLRGKRVQEVEPEGEVVTVKMHPKATSGIEIGTSSIIGTRSNQEDAIFGYEQNREAIGVVCDGMGGLEKGEVASKVAIESFVNAWFEKKETSDIPQFLEEEAIKADEKVFLQKDAQGERMQAGTTIVAAVVKENELYWLSVGDSKIYIIRNGEIFSVTREHNYKMILNHRLEQGELTLEEYTAEIYRAEALISYLGMGNVSLMDINRQSFLLEDKDIVLLCSDGLYKSLSENEILDVVKRSGEDMQNVAETLTSMALGDKQSGQDNTSVVIMKYFQK